MMPFRQGSSEKWCTLRRDGTPPITRGGSSRDEPRVPQEMAIHDLDIMRWLVGDIERVYAEAATHEVVGPGPDATVATVPLRLRCSGCTRP